MEAFVLALKTINSDRSNDFFIETILYDTCSDKLGEHVNSILSRNKSATFLITANPSAAERNSDTCRRKSKGRERFRRRIERRQKK